MSRNYNFHNLKARLQDAGFINPLEGATFGVIVCAVAMKFLPARIANPRQRADLEKLKLIRS